MASKETAKSVVIEEEKKQQEEEAENAVGGGGDEADAPPQTPAEEEPDTVGMYSVWAIPPDYVLPSLHLVMTQLSERYAGPPFQPHVTVLGAHPVLRSKAQQSLQQLCATLLPYTFKITGVTSDLKFHQCVYLTMEPTQEVGLSVCLSLLLLLLLVSSLSCPFFFPPLLSRNSLFEEHVTKIIMVYDFTI
jgi:hypothetical protein